MSNLNRLFNLSVKLAKLEMKRQDMLIDLLVDNKDVSLLESEPIIQEIAAVRKVLEYERNRPESMGYAVLAHNGLQGEFDSPLRYQTVYKAKYSIDPGLHGETSFEYPIEWNDLLDNWPSRLGLQAEHPDDYVGDEDLGKRPYFTPNSTIVVFMEE